MPNSKEHIEQAKHNMNLFLHLTSCEFKDRCKDWQGTILFYTALHAIHSAIAPKELHFKSHVELIKYISTDKTISIFASSYQTLYNISRQARYDCTVMSDGDVEIAKTRADNIYRQLVENSN